MKNYKLLLVAASLFAFAGCDKIDNPRTGDGGGGQVDPTKHYRNVLIEDFTGHKCNNCPNAAEQIEVIKGLSFGSQVYAVGIHVTTFFAGPDANYPEDFRTPTGDQYETFFNISALPTGMVSRTDYTSTGSAHLKNYSNWPSTASVLAAELAKFTIEPTVTYNSTSREVTVDADIAVLEEYTGNLNFIVMITEDGIIAPQKMPDGHKKTDYEHNHVLRTTADGAFGIPLSTTTVSPGDTLNYSGNVILDGAWDENNCNVLMFVYDKDNQEVWQVTEEHVN